MGTASFFLSSSEIVYAAGFEHALYMAWVAPKMAYGWMAFCGNKAVAMRERSILYVDFSDACFEFFSRSAAVWWYVRLDCLAISATDTRGVSWLCSIRARSCRRARSRHSLQT